MAKQASFRMIDVGAKRVTRRRAVACGTIIVGAKAFKLIKSKSLPKGDVLALAEIAGITGAKKTPDLVPLCHILPLDQVSVHCIPQPPDSIVVYCQVAAHAKTGVEMEAIMGTQTALATIWDLVKGTEPALEISNVRLLVKEGGKGGLWIHPDGIPDWLAEQFQPTAALKGIKAAVVVVSDRASSGKYKDKSGPVLKSMLIQAGAKIRDIYLVPDEGDEIEHRIRGLAQYCDLIITTGGTGLSPRDITPDVLESICDRKIPGFGEWLRQDGANFTPMSWLSRSTAGVIGDCLVVALPGSPKAVKEGLEALLPILPHALSMIEGGGHE